MDKGSSNNSPLTVAEMGTLISILANEYNTTVPSILHKLDTVSGDLNALHRLLEGDRSVEWTKDEDDLLAKNADIIKKWKGSDSAELRRKYVQYKSK